MRALFEETGAACSRLLVPEDFYPLSSGPLIRHTVKRSGVSFPTSPLPRVTPYPGVANLRSRHHSIPAPIRLCLSRCCHARPSLLSFLPFLVLDGQHSTLCRDACQRQEHSPESNTIVLTQRIANVNANHVQRAGHGPAQTRGSTSTRTCALYFTSQECIAIDTPTAKCWLKILTWGKCVDQLAPTLQLLIHAQSPAQADLLAAMHNIQSPIPGPSQAWSLDAHRPSTATKDTRVRGSPAPVDYATTSCLWL